jgi:hypothetical protein
MVRATTGFALAGVLALGACAVAPPSGPAVVAMPPQGKSIEQFQSEDSYCRQIGSQAAGGTDAAQAATNNSVGTAVAGTALGAAAGALIGSASGHVGAGAAIGAGAGLLAGSAVGANGAQYSAAGLQRNYDVAYAQCMASKGNQVGPAGPPPGYAGPPVAYVAPPVVVGAPYPYPYYRPYYYGPRYYPY